MATPKLYILIRQDLSLAQQGVQAGHAVAEWCKVWLETGKPGDWYNETLVYVTVKDADHLSLWHRKIIQNGLHPVPFHEPDMAGHMTCIACLHFGNLFDSLPLWEPQPSKGWCWRDAPDPYD